MGKNVNFASVIVVVFGMMIVMAFVVASVGADVHNKEDEVIVQDIKIENPQEDKSEEEIGLINTFTATFFIIIIVAGGVIFIITGDIPNIGYINEKSKIKKERKNAGYESNKVIGEIQYTLHEIIYKARLGLCKEMGIINEKLEEIQKRYEGDKEKYNIVMFKYEKTFKKILKTLESALNSDQIMDEHVYKTVLKAMEYPYKEIITNGDGILDELNNEIEILEGLEKLNTK